MIMKNKNKNHRIKKRKTSVNNKQKTRKKSQSVVVEKNSSVSSRKSSPRGSNRTKINFPYEKPKLRSASAPRKTRGKRPSRLTTK